MFSIKRGLFFCVGLLLCEAKPISCPNLINNHPKKWVAGLTVAGLSAAAYDLLVEYRKWCKQHKKAHPKGAPAFAEYYFALKGSSRAIALRALTLTCLILASVVVLTSRTEAKSNGPAAPKADIDSSSSSSLTASSKSSKTSVSTTRSFQSAPIVPTLPPVNPLQPTVPQQPTAPTATIPLPPVAGVTTPTVQVDPAPVAQQAQGFVAAAQAAFQELKTTPRLARGAPREAKATHAKKLRQHAATAQAAADSATRLAQADPSLEPLAEQAKLWSGLATIRANGAPW
jgi:hypothetical protein